MEPGWSQNGARMEPIQLEVGLRACAQLTFSAWSSSSGCFMLGFQETASLAAWDSPAGQVSERRQVLLVGWMRLG